MRIRTVSEFQCDENDDAGLLAQIIETEVLRLTIYVDTERKADIALTRDSVGDLIATLAAFVLLMED